MREKSGATELSLKTAQQQAKRERRVLDALPTGNLGSQNGSGIRGPENMEFPSGRDEFPLRSLRITWDGGTGGEHSGIGGAGHIAFPRVEIQKREVFIVTVRRIDVSTNREALRSFLFFFVVYLQYEGFVQNGPDSFITNIIYYNSWVTFFFFFYRRTQSSLPTKGSTKRSSQPRSVSPSRFRWNQNNLPKNHRLTNYPL